MLEEFMTRGGLPEEVKTLKTAVGVPSQETVVCFGRICCEASEGKINVASVLLEGSRMEGGRRIKLVLNELPEYALFPGQFVMVEGMNTSGNKLIVKKLCEGVPSPLALTQPSKLKDLYYGKKVGQQQGEPLKLMVASGPFSCSDNLEYEPFRDLLFQAVVQDPVDVLILTGPFIDANHPNIVNGMAGFHQDGVYENVDPWTLFMLKISGVIEGFFTEYENTMLQIVLVPSLSDVHHDVVFPQPPFRDRVGGGIRSPFFEGENLFALEIPQLFRGSKFSKHVHCVGNPSMITINEMVIGISANDVLFHLSKEEVAHRPPGVHRLEKVVEQLVKQQSFYPLFPASGESMPLDMRYAEKWTMPISPDILIVPSKLATFAKKLTNGTLALNPGQLAKGTSGGSFAKLTVYPIPSDKLEEAAANASSSSSGMGSMADEPFLPHHVAARTSIEIKRI
jgi:DNA polymerase alpha subunit B